MQLHDWARSNTFEMGELAVANDFDDHTNDDPRGVVGPSGDARPEGGRRLRTRILVVGLPLLIIVAIVLSLVLTITSRPSGNGRAAHSSPALTPTTKVLYQADWRGAATSWTLPAHWHLVDGHIENDGNGTEPLMVPYYVTSPTYTIEADLTVQKVPNYQACHSYGIQGLNDAGQEQFIGQVACLQPKSPGHGFSENIVTHADSDRDSIATNDTEVSYATRTFVTQVQHNNVGFCIGIDCLSNLNSTTPLWPMHIAIVDIGVQLTLTRLVITSP